MTPSALRYQASREWMEEEILSGRPLDHRRHTLCIDPAVLSVDLQARLESLLDGAVYLEDLERVLVLDSGLNPSLSFGPNQENFVPMDDLVVSRIGILPEIPRPTDQAVDVISAWETWMELYRSTALIAIESLIQESPARGRGSDNRKVKWSGRAVELHGFRFAVSPSDGPQAMQDIRAGLAWGKRANELFAAESTSAAKEATGPSREEVQAWYEDGEAEIFASHYRLWAKRFYAAAKAHDRALRSDVLDFDAEMERWAGEFGSERLRLGIADGYRMNARYLSERLAAEAPGFYAMPTRAATEGWAKRANSPSEAALRLRRAVEAAITKSAPKNIDGPPRIEIAEVVDPPVEIYIAQGQEGPYADLPDPRGWDWKPDNSGGTYGKGPQPFEAVIVHGWLSRFTLIGAVAEEEGHGPPWVWAVPEADRFHEDGTVIAEDPDERRPTRAKRKPPGGDDDIPF